ncbi:hypothetical protein DOH76_16730 [Salmonella enterica subsp. enterica serovar Oranienburg]|nr:hypothetical protein [Salmonella enterica]EBI7017121.1 hypothetical protein [Salmonella enterica]EBV3241186.1 hypothetical protein [Salmonella enterica subsp. enterica serovar Oranienburg]ECD0387790.1 hypothetical protein [Salmonella enterica subsp. enterica serovar Oranienburg]EGX3621613.1 hypothetical protein [Salmonella enterica]
MNKPLKIAMFFFTLICASGTFCALAAGVEWGTPAAGTTAVITLVTAVFVALGIYGMGKLTDF